MPYFLSALLLITLLYNIVAIIINKGIPESISSTAYIYGNCYKAHFLFTIFCFITGFTLFPIWIGVSKASLEFLIFICISGILFAGATPFFKEKHQAMLHYLSGIIAVVSYVLWLCFSKCFILLACETLIITILILLDKKNFVYYVEIIG